MISTDIRNLLRSKEHEDGLTASQIASVLGKGADQISAVLTNMPDLYRDRWLPAGDTWAAVWVAVRVPPDCPRPDPKRKRKATA